MDMAMVNLQAAVMASAASSTDAVTADSTEGASFSDVLAAKGGDAEVQASADTDATAMEGIETDADVQDGVFADIVNQIENADEGLKKAMKLLLETVLNAFKASDDGQERKTDIFMLFSDTSAEDGLNGANDMLLTGSEDNIDIAGDINVDITDDITDDDITRDMLLTGAEILNQIGMAIKDADAKSDEDVFAELNKVVAKLFDDDDTDENTAADVLAAMFNIPAEDIPYMTEEAKTEAVESAVEILTAPKQAVAEIEPEAVKEMEKLYSDLKAVVKNESKPLTEIPFKMSFTALKINDASSQVVTVKAAVTDTDKAPDTRTSSEAVPEAEPELAPELAVMDIMPRTVTEATVTEVRVQDTNTAASVENQITEKVSETLFEMKGENDTQELVMVLKPENLGQVAVKLVKENGALSVMLSAQYEDVGNMLNERVGILSSSLENQNVTVKSVEVVNPGTAAAEMGLDFTNQGFGRHGYSDGGNGNSNYRGLEDIDEIEETDSVSGGEKLKEAKLWTIA